jgi:hypothetical protein
MAVGTLAASLDDARGIVGIGRPRICAVEAVHRGRDRQVRSRIPLCADFIVRVNCSGFICSVMLVNDEN